MKKLILAAVAVIGLAAGSASAAGGCNSPYCGGQAPGEGPFSYLFHKRPVPAFQAAPWYLYWPYNSHFQTAAPLTGAYYAPPAGAGQMVNPYFPAGTPAR